MHPIYARLAELWNLHEYGERPLTDEEWSDLKNCLTVHVQKARKLGRLYNLSYMAHLSDDTDWQHEICAKIDRLKEELFDYC